jgi:HD-GYP domain-containing protein (c-di-GMP phosphodiesterase class II)
MINEGKYMSISPEVILPGVMPKFKIFFLSAKGYYVLWALEGNRVTDQQLAKLTKSGIKEVFVDLDERFKYEEYLETNLGKILENPVSSIEQKAEIFSRVSTYVVKAAFETSFGTGSLGPTLVERTKSMIKNALFFLTETKALDPLAKMVGHDYTTYEHATKVLWFLMAFLKENPDILEIVEPDYHDLPEPQKRDLLAHCGVAAMLHDVGKVFIPSEILNKNEPLSGLEWEIIKRHPLSSLAMFLGTEIPEFVKKAVLQHHEDFNGCGYPFGLKGLDISILGRVLRIIDTFEAMTSRRPYKEAIPPKAAMEIMIGTPQKNLGGAFQALEERDLNMKDCFDEELLKHFIVFLGKLNLNE